MGEDSAFCRDAFQHEERVRRSGRRLIYVTQDHPAAKGRTPLPGEQAWTFRFTLADGTSLEVAVGRVGRDAFVKMLAEEAVDDAIEGAGGALPGDGPGQPKDYRPFGA